MKSKIIVFLTFILFLSNGNKTLANESFVTIVHPIRGRDLWLNQSIELLDKQISLSTKHNLATTWLVQYDALIDEGVVFALNKLPANHEIGLFLEVSETLATDAFVPYTKGSGDWARPDKVFFSGYTIEERQRLADRLVRTFEATFGYKPKSVGAWYIDAPTLSYLHDKYGVIGVITCADQYSTDKYQIWGKYFGVPYYPSRQNTLMPAQTAKNLLPVVNIQWAQRDPVRAYGPDVDSSTYSLQANDYVGNHHLSSDYFKKLFDVYINSENPVSQVTVGLEVGMETRFLPELKRQIDQLAFLNRQGLIKPVTISQFASWFSQHIKGNKNFAIVSQDLLGDKKWGFWWMTPFYRAGLLLQDGILILRDLKIYDEDIRPIDDAFADKRLALYRTVPSLIDGVVTKNEQVLVDRVISISGKRKDNQFVVQAGDKDIVFSQQSIFLQDKLIFKRQNYDPVPNSIKRYLMRIFTPLFRLSDSGVILPPIVRYSRLNGSFMAGIKLNKENLLGIKLQPLRVGLFSFPFQTMVRFKQFLPKINLRNLYQSDAQFETDAFLESHQKSKVVIVSRNFLSLPEIESRERSGRKRVFENDAVQVWRKEKGDKIKEF